MLVTDANYTLEASVYKNTTACSVPNTFYPPHPSYLNISLSGGEFGFARLVSTQLHGVKVSSLRH